MQDTGQTALVKSFTIYMHVFFENGEMSLSPSLIIACRSSMYLNVYKTNSKRSGRENKALQLVGILPGVMYLILMTLLDTNCQSWDIY
jgi:hypothetical protein